jgi:hypothetical protein
VKYITKSPESQEVFRKNPLKREFWIIGKKLTNKYKDVSSSLTMKIFISIVTILLIASGFIGIIIPGLPASPLIFLGAIIYGFGFGFERIGATIYIILGILTAVSLTIDYLGSVLGAKKLGASKFGIIGAILGLFIGFIIGSIWGLLIGPFVGAFLGELIRRKRPKESLKAGLGATLGFMGGFLLRFPICFVMIILIVWGIIK